MTTIHNPSKCCKCMQCLDECLNSAILVGIEGIYIDQDACIECGACVEVCPNKAMEKQNE